MSGVMKGVTKIFKKTVKVVKKLAPVILAAAAIYFTAGAALGVPAAAGGWGGAVSGLTGSLGLSSTLSSVVTGAVTQAGYGAAIGGVISAVSGGDMSKGLLRGAAAGAVTGGVTGAVAAPAAGAGATVAKPTNLAAAGALPGQAPSRIAGGAGVPSLTGAPGADTIAASGSLPKIGPAILGEPAPPKTGLLSFINQNPTLAGGVIQGVGQGISGLAQAGATQEAAETASAQREREQDRIASNFGTSGGAGLLTNANIDTASRPPPVDRFVAAGTGGRWVYNPNSGRVELTPTTG